jgi:hypothetical protein
MTPSLEIGNGNWAVQSDSLLGYKTINGKYYPREMSVTRATTATRVNAAGLVELVPYNLVQYSEMFADAYWTKNLGTLTANVITAPNGTLTADLFTKTSAVNTVSQVASPGGSPYTTTGVHTMSIYIKPNVGNLVLLRLDNSGNSCNAVFNFSTLTFTNIGANFISSSYQSLPNGWYRLILTGNVTSTSWTISACNLFANPTNDSMYIWGAQVVEGTQALNYLPTTDRLDIPRVDYSTGSPALLVEPQRTNLLNWSEDFTNVVWTKNAGVSVTSDSSISPSGVQNADTIVGATGPYVFGGNNTFARGVGSLSSSTPYIFSVYLKGSGSVTITCRDGGTGLTNNIVCALTSSWQRFEISRTTAVASTALAYVFSDASGNFDIWGAQLEAGNYSTSYIPTTSASVTRNADQVLKTGISSLIGQTEGTIFLDFTLLPNNENTAYLFSVSDGTQANLIRTEIFVVSPTDSRFRTGISTLGVSQMDALTNITQLNNKMAISYKLNEVKIFLNGVLVVTDTSATIPATSGVYLGNRNNIGNYIGSYYKSFMLFPTALTDTQCINLTTI